MISIYKKKNGEYYFKDSPYKYNDKVVERNVSLDYAFDRVAWLNGYSDKQTANSKKVKNYGLNKGILYPFVISK